MADNRLLTDDLCKQGFCGGHFVKQPAYPDLFQVVLLHLGVYETLAALKWRLWAKLLSR